MIDVLACCSLAVWSYLVLARGRYWLIREETIDHPVSPARVTAVIPARDEAETIAAAVASLSTQPLDIVVVDDHSSDGTAQIARAASDGVTVVQARALPPGWSGKVWALNEGVAAAMDRQPEYILFTDADIVHTGDTVRQLLARMIRDDLDMASFMVELRCQSLAERALIPAFVYFFFMLYPPRWISSPHSRTAGAAGGCILVRTSALARIGGLISIQGELIDDCALARAVKSSGGRLWLGVTRDARSIREYRTFAAVGRMISRTAYTQLRYSALMLAATVLAMGFVFLLPVVLTLRGSVVAGASWLIMGATFLPVLRLYRRSWAWAPLLPVIACFYTGATIHSAVRHWQGRGGMWKARVNPRQR